MENLSTNVIKPQTGEHSDFAPVDQPQGTYRKAVNAVNTTSGGNTRALSNELGNLPCGEITEGYVQLGKAYVGNDTHIIFSVAINENSSEIGLLDNNCKYTPIVNANLGFRLNKQITTTYRLRRGCERVVYFTDGNTSMKYFNFAKPEDFYSESYRLFLANGSVGTFTGSKWNVAKFDLFPAYTVPCSAEVRVLSGGQLPSGTFNFAIRYLDDNLNPTNFIYATQLVPVYDSPSTSAYNNITGSSNIGSDPIAGTPPTNKQIKVFFDGLDANYKFYQIAVIEATDKTGLITRTLLSPTIPISRNEYTYDGNISGYSEINDEELTIGKIDIEAVEHLEQQENRLILSNTKGKQVNYCNFQKFASKILSSYIISEANASDANDSGNPKSPDTYWEKQSYMGGDDYAMAIVYVFRGGLESPAFHIPGRAANKYFDPVTGLIQNTNDQDVITTWVKDIAFINNNAANYNSLPINQKVKKFQAYDTSIKCSTGAESTGAMAYHENDGVFYEAKNDCNNNDYWGLDGYGISLTGKPIRHHRFPTRFTEPHVRSGQVQTGKTGLYLTVALKDEQVFPTGGSYTVIIDYESDSVPKNRTITVNEDNFPLNDFLIEEAVGGYEIFNVISVTGTAVDATALFTVTVNKSTINTGFTDAAIVRNLGIRFSNIQYPHPDIVGHYFVRGKRDSQNRTVIDKGFSGPLKVVNIDNRNYNAFAYFNAQTPGEKLTANNFIFTPRTYFNKENIDGDYLRYEGEFQNTGINVGSNEEDGAGSWTKEVNMKIEYRVQSYGAFTPNRGNQNFRINKSILLDGLAKNESFNGVNAPLYNLSWSNKAHILNTDQIMPDTNRDISYVSLKVNRNVHPSLEDIVYQRMHNCMLTIANSNKIFGGDVFISRWDIANSLYRKQKKGIFKGLLKLILIVGAAVATIATAGAGAPALAAALGAVGITASAIGISAIIIATAVLAGTIGITSTAIEIITTEINDGVLEQVTDDGEFNDASGNGIRFSSYIAYANELMEGMYVESEVNASLRQTEEHVCGAYFAYQTGIYEYFRERWLMYNIDENVYEPKGYCCPETYNYNKDYSRENEQSVYFGLASTYDCCSDCKESHPNRTYYSEQAFQEELTDNYRVFKPNNYVDLEAEHGAITNIVKRNNNLFIQTEEALWLLPQSQQERVTGELITFIGTGEFFSIPPKKIIDSDIGTAGTQHKWATINTPKGLLFVNELESKVYLYDQSLRVISDIGIRYWFREKLTNHFARQFQIVTGTIFPNSNNPANPYGVGIHSAYDSQYNRILVTKRDYLMLSSHVMNFRLVTSDNNLMPSDLVDGQLVFDTVTNKFVVSKGLPSSYLFVDFNNQQYFENKSWTRSFSLDEEYQSWTSLHSYIPNFYIYTHNSLMSCISSSRKIWRHHTPNLYQEFYGVKYPHIIEGVSVKDKMQTVTTEDLQFQTVAKRFDSISGEMIEDINITFNKMIAYNGRQSTGELLLVVNKDDADFMIQQVQDAPGIAKVERAEKDWNINDLRDFVIDPNAPLFLTRWSDIKTNYPIDKVVNQANINYFKDWFELESLRDKYLIIRLKFDNFTDVQLTTNYLLATQNISYR